MQQQFESARRQMFLEEKAEPEEKRCDKEACGRRGAIGEIVCGAGLLTGGADQQVCGFLSRSNLPIGLPAARSCQCALLGVVAPSID